MQSAWNDQKQNKKIVGMGDERKLCKNTHRHGSELTQGRTVRSPLHLI